MSRLVSAAVASMTLWSFFAGAAPPMRPASPSSAVPRDAIGAIIDAFSRHAVVALGEGPHGNEQGHAFRLSLIRDPRFAATVHDILVEFGSGRYQHVMDRFVSGGLVSDNELRPVWRDTTAPGPVWDRAIYEEFFRAVRSVNMSLPAERRLRVLLGDAPIQWEKVTRREDVRAWGMRKDSYAGMLIKREVLAKQRRALIIYGDGHLQGRGFPAASLINVVERAPAATKMFAISSSFYDLSRIQADVGSWPVPSVARIRGTVIGARPYAQFYPMPPGEGWNVVRLEDQFDAVLYLGNGRPITAPLPPALCADDTYITMRLNRMALDDVRVSGPGMDWLTKYCAGVKRE
jgi:hypothetical protein